MRLILALLAFVSFARAVPADSTAPAVAIVSTPETADLGALLTNELSSDPEVTLVDRTDLAKAGDEARVRQMAGSDSIGLGKLVGADGLFFIDREGGSLRVRFTAVGLGYDLFDDQAGPGGNLTQEAKAMAHRIVDYAPKLRLDPAKAIPLSVINLRADTGDAETVALERPLTLLVESRLSFVPEYVVLERRHAWSLSFEHSLDLSGQTLLRGAYLIDGTISRTGGSGDCTVNLRIRGPHGGPEKTAAITGTAGDPAALAKKILAEIENAIPHASAAPTSFDTGREADEYLHEALWGWRAQAPESALEAVDSAELLGASDYTVVPLRVNILCALADQGMEMYDPKDRSEPPPVLTTPTLDERVDAIERAIDDVARYRDEKMEKHLQGFVPENSTERFFFRTREILPRVAWIGSTLLLLLENEQSPRADELRMRLRKATGYDPLHGKTGVMIGNSGFDNGNSADPFADDWARTLEEELTWYRLEFVDSNAYTPRWVWSDPTARFCSRFLTTPEARRQAWNQFVDSLKTNPKSQRMALVLKTYDPDPVVADQAYRDYLAYLYARRDQVGSATKYDPLFGDYWRINEPVESRNAQAGLPLLHAILNTPQPGPWGVDTLKMLWRPEYFSAVDAPVLWREINGYAQRRNDLIMRKDGRQDSSFLAQMDELLRSFREKFPEIARAPLPEDTAPPAPDAGLPKLVVSRFWNPWLAPDYPANGSAVLSSYTAGGDDLYICSYRGGEVKGIIFDVHLPDFATRIIPTMDDSFVQNVLWTPQALYTGLRSGNQVMRHELARYDLATGTWTKHELNFGYLQNEMFAIGRMLYLGSAYPMSVADPDCGLTKYDWDKDQATTLASSRRRPAQNQFDDASPYRIDSVFAGPGGKPVAGTLRGEFYIRETPGAWPPLMNGAFADETSADGDRTLVYNNNGEATLIDPKAAVPLPLMASDLPTYRALDADKGHAPPVPTPWAAQAIFDCPPGKGKDLAGNTAYNDGHLYIFSQPDKMRDEYELLDYGRALGRAPVHIPLEFHFDDPDRAVMSKHPGALPNGWSIAEFENPHSPFEPSVLGTSQGLCLKLMMGGFWFIPYHDIKTYVRNLPNPGRETVESPPPDAKVSKAAPDSEGDTIDPGDPTSFR